MHQVQASRDLSFIPRSRQAATYLTVVNLVNSSRVILHIETPASLHPWSAGLMTPANEESHSGARALYLDSLSEAPKVFAGGVLLDSLG